MADNPTVTMIQIAWEMTKIVVPHIPLDNYEDWAERLRKEFQKNYKAIAEARIDTGT